MKIKKILLPVLFSLCISKALAQQPVDTIFNNKLIQLAHKRIEAFDLGDTSLWSPYVANEYIIATPTGKVITKTDVMKGFGPPMPGYKDVFNFEDVHVIHDGNLAVMSYRIMEHEWWGKQDDEVPPLRKTDTYVYRDERWQLLASHETFYPVVRTPVKANPALYKKYPGRYEVMPGLVYTVSSENGTLIIRENNNPSGSELLPLSATTFYSLPDSGFFNEGGVGVVEFVTGKKGGIPYLAFRRYATEIRAKRL